MTIPDLKPDETVENVLSLLEGAADVWIANAGVARLVEHALRSNDSFSKRCDVLTGIIGQAWIEGALRMRFDGLHAMAHDPTEDDDANGSDKTDGS